MASQIPQVTLTDSTGAPVTVTGGALATSGGGGGAITAADGALATITAYHNGNY